MKLGQNFTSDMREKRKHSSYMVVAPFFSRSQCNALWKYITRSLETLILEICEEIYPSMLRVDVLDFSLQWQKHPTNQPEGRSIYVNSWFQRLQSRSSLSHVSAPAINQDSMMEGSSSAYSEKEAYIPPNIWWPTHIQGLPSLINHLCKYCQGHTQKCTSSWCF